MNDLITRKPTGKPPWPILLIAGSEKSGKSYACAQASASDLVGRTLWVSVGEDDPDEYGAIDGARFEIVEHNGTYRDLLNKLTAAAAQPAGDVPNLLVLDSATRLWDLLCDEAQVVANRRAAAKAEKYNKAAPTEDVTIGMDLWNTAKQRWQHILDVLRDHAGPSIVTARLEQSTVVDARGEPTKEKAWKVKAEKGLPFDVGMTVELPARGEALLTGVRSLRFAPGPGSRTPYPDFTVDKLWRDLGLHEAGATSPRQHTATDASAAGETAADAARRDVAEWCQGNGIDLPIAVARFAEQYDGRHIKDAPVGEVKAFLAAWQTEAAAQAVAA